MNPSAKIIADSISSEGVRLVTMEVTFHRWVLAEVNTHRVMSRNSASSRAIPVHKQLARIAGDPAEPVAWASEQKGMQGGGELAGDPLEESQRIWRSIREGTLKAAAELVEQGLHKSLVNRLIEPHSAHTAVITATAWENFFEQRCSPLAQPEIRVVAEAMKAAYDDSDPQKLTEGEWHLPYIQPEDLDHKNDVLIRVSAARCARVSYLTQDGTRDMDQDITLFERLVTAKPAHWSPLEHVATPWEVNRQAGALIIYQTDEFARMIPMAIDTSHLPRVGNLLGWRSLRTEVETLQGVVTYR